MEPVSYCLQQVHRWDRMRALALRHAPQNCQDAALALLALNLEFAKVAPLVSEPTLAEIRFLWWQEALEELRANKPPRNHPVVLSLHGAAARDASLLASAGVLLEGWRHTSRQESLPDWPDLEACLLSTHGSLTAGFLALVGGSDAAAQKLSQALGLAWGYASLREAFLKSGDFDLLPKAALATPPSSSEAEAREPFAVAAELLYQRALMSYDALREKWPQAPASHRNMLSFARLIPLRIVEPQRAESLAAWQLFKGQFFRNLPRMRGNKA